MESIYLEVIILLLLVWIFGNKIFPQIIVVFLTISMMIYQVTNATDLKSIIGVMILYAVVIVYAALSAYTAPTTED